MRFRAMMLAVGLAAVPAFPAAAGNPDEHPLPEVLIVGTYHMSNPGRDLANMQADDVLAPKRQAEIAQVIAALERFRPTRVAVEAGFSDQRIAQRYADYRAGSRELSRNEVEQLGFRLAGKLGHAAVYPEDADGEFPYPRLQKYAQATGRAGGLEALEKQIRALVADLDAYLASHTILETLLHMNSDPHVSEGLGIYFRQAEFGEPWDWAGADLVADWFRRNMRIYTNIVGLIDSADERVLVIYGAGHLGWLQFAFDNNPTMRLRHLAEFVD